jgi:aldose 1-epimerase
MRMQRIAVFLGILLAPAAVWAQYSAERAGDVVTLTDKQHQMVVSILPGTGDEIFSIKVKGHDIVDFADPSIAAFEAHPGVTGIPFLAPWANRLDEDAFYANGKQYTFNMTLGNVRGKIPIHGFLAGAPWQVVALKADRHAAWLTARLDFYRHPDWMAQWPFAQTIEMTQRLHDGVLEVHTKLMNLSTDPMPVAVGFHPYLRLTDSPRDKWTIQVGARTHYLLSPEKIPTGETEPITKVFPDPAAAALQDYRLDDLFGDLARDSQGRAHFSVSDGHQRVTVEFGPNYQAAVLYSPGPWRGTPRPGRPVFDPNFICFEPMASITDALNLEHAGKFHGVQSVPPGGTWEDSFWIVPSGF